MTTIGQIKFVHINAFGLATISPFSTCNSKRKPIFDSPPCYHCKTMISSLPFDVLHRILDLSLPPKFLVSPVDSRSKPFDGPWKRYMALKYSLSLVCKPWRPAALRLLFSDAVIESPDSAALFLEALRSSSNSSSRNTAHFVRSVDFLLEDEERKQALVKYRKIRLACPNLQHVGLGLRRPRSDIIPMISQLSLTSLNMAIQESSSVSASDIVASLRAVSESVTHLHLHMIILSEPVNTEEWKLATVSQGVISHPNAMAFEKLVELEMTFPLQYRSVSGLVEHWTMPKLTRVAIHSPRDRSFLSGWQMVQMHSHQILYLHNDTPTDLYGIRSWEDIRRCLMACTSLQHLVLRAYDNRALVNDSVEFIDVWGVICQRTENNGGAMRIRGGARTKQSARKSTGGRAPRRQLAMGPARKLPANFRAANRLPRLRQIRILDETLLYLGHLPLDVPPDRVLYEEDEFSMKYDGIHTRHEVGRLIHVRNGEGLDLEEEDYSDV